MPASSAHTGAGSVTATISAAGVGGTSSKVSVSPGSTACTVKRLGASAVPRATVTWLPAATTCDTEPSTPVVGVDTPAPAASWKTTSTPDSGWVPSKTVTVTTPGPAS